MLVEPQSFILEGGMTEDKSDWKVLMQPIAEDAGFKMNSVTAYVYNFVELPGDSGTTDVG